MSFTNTPSSTLTNDATNLANNAAGGQALSPVSGDPLIGANPTVNTIDTAAPIGGTAQGMPAPKSFGSYTNSVNSNALGDWGRKAETGGIPGDGSQAPQGGSGGYGTTWASGAPPSASSTAATGTPKGSDLGTAAMYSAPGNAPGAGNNYTMGGGYLGAASGGPIPSIAHTSKKVKGYDDGGSVQDGDDDQDQGSIPDPGSAIPSDPTDPGDVSNFNPGNGNQSESNAIMQAIYNTLSYGRQKNGLSNAIVNAAYQSIPTKPAGPGGDQTRGGPQDRSNQTAGNIPTKPAGPGGDQTRGGPQDRGNQTSQNDNDGNYQSAAGGGFIGPAISPEMGRADSGVMDRAPGGAGGGLGASRGGGGGGGWSQHADLGSGRGGGGFMAMKKGGAIPEPEDDD